MKRNLKKIIFTIVLTCLILTCFIEIKFLSPKRVLGHTWEPYGGKDYLKIGKSFLSTEDSQLKGDTLILDDGRKYLVKYCNFGNLWLTDLKMTHAARCIYTMPSKDWWTHEIVMHQDNFIIKIEVQLITKPLTN